MAASPMPFPAPMKGIGASSTTAERVSRLIKTKLTFIGHSADSGEEITLAPRLHFTSFEALEAQTETLLRSLPGAKDSSLLSLQYRDAEGDLIDLLTSTFDPEDFRGVSKVVLRAKAHHPAKQQQQQQQSPPPLLVAPARKKKTALVETKKAAPRRVLGRRDPNTLYAAPPLSTVGGGGGLRGQNGTEKKQITPRCRPAAAAAPAAPAAAAAAAVRSSNVTTSTTMPTAVKESNATMARYHQQLAASRNGGRAPEFVFGTGEPRVSSSRDGDGGTATTGRGRAKAAAEPGRRRQRATKGAVSSSRKPSWNNGNEPAWEEVRLAPRVAGAATAAVLLTVAVASRDVPGTYECCAKYYSYSTSHLESWYCTWYFLPGTIYLVWGNSVHACIHVKRGTAVDSARSRYIPGTYGGTRCCCMLPSPLQHYSITFSRCTTVTEYCCKYRAEQSDGLVLLVQEYHTRTQHHYRACLVHQQHHSRARTWYRNTGTAVFKSAGCYIHGN